MQVERWIDQQSVLHEPVGAEVTPAVVEVVASTPDDGAAAQVGEHPTGWLEPEVGEVVSVEAVELELDPLALPAGEEGDSDLGPITIEVHDDAIEPNQALGGADQGGDVDAGGLTEED